VIGAAAFGSFAIACLIGGGQWWASLLAASGLGWLARDVVGWPVTQAVLDRVLFSVLAKLPRDGE
jgi:hypothetical protein